MHRAAIRALRTASRCTPRKLAIRSCRSDILSYPDYVLGRRAAFSSSRAHLSGAPLRSSMYIRRFSVALASTLVAYGAWYTYRGVPARDAANSPSLLTRGQQPRSLSSSTVYPDPAQISAESEVAVESARKAVVVTPDTIYTGAIEGDEPISKYTDDSGRKVLEMLTPEQATQKLRRNEESFLVGRGQGVVRYDVVQIPSNDPIEDDHSEKIVEVPYGLASTVSEHNANSDWMFWGVYDGHRYVE